MVGKECLSAKSLDASYKHIDEIEFTSTNKYHVKLIQPLNEEIHNFFFGYRQKQEINKRLLLMVKGAPDVLVDTCEYLLESDGGERLMGESEKKLVGKKLGVV